MFNDRVYFRHKLIDDSWAADSSEFINYKLMLRKKTKKVWVPILQDDWFETKEEAEKIGKEHWAFIKAIEVEILKTKREYSKNIK